MMNRFFQFQDPWLLGFLLLVPVIYWLQKRFNRPVSIRFPSINLFQDIPSTWRQKFSFLPGLLRHLALVFLVIALARPQAGNSLTEVLSEGIDILLTIDTSGSMKALDFHIKGSETNRLDVVKNVVKKFVSRREHDRIGMVIFGEDAYTQAPLTHDTATLLNYLDWIRIGIVGDGTAIGNALATSVKRLKDQTTKSKVIILLTDGRNNAGEIAPLTAARIAKEFDIKVYTVGVGSRGPVPYPEETPFGIRRIYAELDIDEETLQEIASLTGGRYFRATETEELEKIYETIDKLEKSEVKIKRYSEYEELFAWFAAPGLALLALSAFLNQTIFRKLP